MNKIAGLFIGTYCIEHGRARLQCDPGFEPTAALPRTAPAALADPGAPPRRRSDLRQPRNR